MKKMIKKIAAAFMAFALVAAGMLAVNKADVKAADGDWIVLGSITAWDASGAGQMVDNGDGTFSYTYTGTIGEEIEFKIANANAFATDNDWNTVIGDGKKSNFKYKLTSDTVVITYDNNVTDRAGVSVVGADNAKTPIVTTGFNVAGDEALTGKNWSQSDNAMTLNNGVYSKSFEGIAQGTYYYKILENGTWDSDYVYGLRDANSNNGVVVVEADNSTVTFSVDATTKAVTVTQSVPQTPPPAGEEETTTAAKEDEKETTTAAKEDEKETTTVAKEDEKETTTVAKEDEKETTTVAKDDENTTTTVADDENGNGAGGGTGSGSVDDTPAGDNSMVAIFAILAVLAAAGVVTVVVAKRRAIEE